MTDLDLNDPTLRRGAKLLRRLRINEVSAVDAPANPGAKIALFKRDTQPRSDFDKTLDEAVALAVQAQARKAVTTNRREHTMNYEQIAKAATEARQSALATLALIGQRRFPGLSPAQAFTKACAEPEGPGLYRLYREADELAKRAADDMRRRGSVNDGTDKLWDELRERAQGVRMRHPEMSAAQAFTRACEENPALYQEASRRSR
ncbi:MAG: hypothetical protein KDA64_08960 [Rhodospirillaceae bacterium]|nr:hypothetical protein [Rhodospirillaceae bacterium]